MESVIEREQRAFIRREMFNMTLAATTQRSGLYLPEASEAKRRKFQDALRARLDALAADYAAPVAEATHVANIDELSRVLSAEHGAVFSEGRFRIGLAQKALNLYLKSLWCLGQIAMPPHCPLDGLVFAQVEAHTHERITRIDNLALYKAIIVAARKEAKELPLAVWELHLANRAAAVH